MNKIDCTLTRIYLDRGGYDRNTGSYYGVGQKVWQASFNHANDDLNHAFRSNDLQCARAYIRAYVERYGYDFDKDLKFVR